MPDKYNYPLQDADHENTALILPVYNSDKHLNSLISQLLEHFPADQIIAVDDGSNDNSAQICRNKEITLIEFEQNTRERCCSACRNEKRPGRQDINLPSPLIAMNNTNPVICRNLSSDSSRQRQQW